MENFQKKKLLVGVDGSEDSYAAFDYACRTTLPHDTVILANCFRAYEWDFSSVLGQAEPVKAEENFMNSKRLLEKYGKQCQERHRNCQLKAIPYVGGTSKISDALCTEANQSKANQIIVGNRGISFGSRLWLGSVSAALMNCSPTTVTIVKSPNYQKVKLTDLAKSAIQPKGKEVEQDIFVAAPIPIRMPPPDTIHFEPKILEKAKLLIHPKGKEVESDIFVGAPTPIRMPSPDTIHFEPKILEKAKLLIHPKGKEVEQDIFVGAPTPIRMPPPDTIHFEPKFMETSMQKSEKEDQTGIFVGAPTPVRMPVHKIEEQRPGYELKESRRDAV